jgi:hypothetical protein
MVAVRTHLAPAEGQCTLCDLAIDPRERAVPLVLYVPVGELRSLDDACRVCVATARRLQLGAPILRLRAVIAHPI